MERVSGVLFESFADAERNVQAISPNWHVVPKEEGLILWHGRVFRSYDVDQSLDINVYYWPGVIVLLVLLLGLLVLFFGVRFVLSRRRST